MKPTPAILAEALRLSTHGMQNAAGRWAERRERGLDDEQLTDAIKFEFGIMHDAGLREHDRWRYCAQGEFQPKLSVYPGFNSRSAGPPIQGPALLKEVRALLQIPHPCGALQIELFTSL
jgi:hypothetical protein